MYKRQVPWLKLAQPVQSFALQEGGTRWGALTVKNGREVWRTSDLPVLPQALGMQPNKAETAQGEDIGYLPDATPKLLPNQVDYANYVFEFERTLPAIDNGVTSPPDSDPLLNAVAPLPSIPTPLPYRTNYAVDQLLSQVDNLSLIHI